MLRIYWNGISTLIIALGALASIANAEGATELGEYLNSGDWQAPPGGGLRVDSLAEDTRYSSRHRGQPPMGWHEKNHAFHQWLPPLLIPDFSHADPNDPRRHIGLGHPLEGTSWRNRPMHIGWLFGGMYGDDLIDNQFDQSHDMFGGYRVGWDLDHYWGCEARVAWARLDVRDATTRRSLPASRDVFFDANLAYYPWGDARWRPYASAGFGWADFAFVDANGTLLHDEAFTMPLAIGGKYYWKKWLALRGELMDNIAFSSNRTDSMHNFSLTLGIEYRMGPPQRIYSW